METLEYITYKAMIQCDQGGAPGLFTPTYNQTIKINSCLVSTKIDQIPLTNIPTFITCKKTGGKCTPAPTVWEETYPVKVKGQPTLIGQSCNNCSTGGQITFLTSGQIPLTPEEEEQLQGARDDVQKAYDKEQEEKNKPWWQKAGEFVVDCIPVVGPVVSLVKNISEGNWGMAALDVGFLALDVVGLVGAPFTGGASVAGATAAKVGIRQAIKAGAKQVAKKVGREALEAGAKRMTEMLSKLSIRRLAAERLCVFACFPAGTPVASEYGLKNIEDLQEGDRIWAYDELLQKNVLEEILYSFEKKTQLLISILLENGDIIETTPDHEFWSLYNEKVTRKKKDTKFLNTDYNYGIICETEQLIEEADWIMAEDLVAGDVLLNLDNRLLKIADIQLFVKNTMVYNFCVSNNHSYYVGRSQVLVHNKICYKEVFFKAFPALRGKVVVHHAIEQQVMRKYPGVIAEAEMHSLSNLRGIPKKLNNTLHLSDIRKSWNKFYKRFDDAGITPTRQQIDRYAESIDKKFGHLFDPPI